MEGNQIELRCILELLAKPKEMAVDALKKILANIEEEGSKLEVSDATYSEPKKVEQDFYSAFATFKIKADPVAAFGFVLDYAPSSVEVHNAKDIKLSITDLQAILNDISGRLNQMDQNIKIFSAQNVILTNENAQLKKKLGQENPQVPTDKS
jgi:hypothetical protein